MQCAVTRGCTTFGCARADSYIWRQASEQSGKIKIKGDGRQTFLLLLSGARAQIRLYLFFFPLFADFPKANDMLIEGISGARRERITGTVIPEISASLRRPLRVAEIETWVQRAPCCYWVPLMNLAETLVFRVPVCTWTEQMSLPFAKRRTDIISFPVGRRTIVFPFVLGPRVVGNFVFLGNFSTSAFHDAIFERKCITEVVGNPVTAITIVEELKTAKLDLSSETMPQRCISRGRTLLDLQSSRQCSAVYAEQIHAQQKLHVQEASD